jgi:hypothetical protein
MSGSFPETWSGELDSNQSAATFTGACGGKRGVTKLQIASGQAEPP